MLTSRLPFSTGGGLLLSAAFFWLLWITVNAPLQIDGPTTGRVVDFTPAFVEIPPRPKERRQKPDLVLEERMPAVDPIDVPRTQPSDRPRRPVRGTAVDVGAVQRPTFGTSGSDHDAEPFIRFDPRYPAAAERRGIEGWVLVQFSVSANGRVQDLVVVDSDPPGVFEKETLEAVARWRYRPMVEEGMPIERVGLRTLLRFNLD